MLMAALISVAELEKIGHLSYIPTCFVVCRLAYIATVACSSLYRRIFAEKNRDISYL